MPLHLLGKKSWNVYNADNIARVRRDEAAEAAKEAAAEQRMQEEDAARRIALLRGETVHPTPAPSVSDPSLEADVREESHRRRGADPHHPSSSSSSGRDTKRRRLRGEDDTERDIRVAREDQQARATAAATNATKRTSDAPLVDARGHIALFAPPPPPRRTEKETASETKPHATDTRREGMATKDAGPGGAQGYQGMRFADAAGFKQDVGAAPWYSGQTKTKTKRKDEGEDERRDGGVDVWGNPDPRRRQRESVRMAASDPLLAMQQGVQGVRRAEREKRRWKEERGREVEALIREEREKEREVRRKERRQRRRRHEGGDEAKTELDADAERRERKARHRTHRREERDRGRHAEAGRHSRRHDGPASRSGSEDYDSLDGFRLDDEARREDRGEYGARHRRSKRSRSRSRSRDRARDRRPRAPTMHQTA